MIDIRAHHIYSFTAALVSKKFRKNYLKLVDYGGVFDTGEQIQKMENFLESISDNTLVRIVLGKDDICSMCEIEEKACSWPDSVWDCREMLRVVVPNEVRSVKYLKKQYLLYQKCKRKSNWKKIISASRNQLRIYPDRDLLEYDCEQREY